MSEPPFVDPSLPPPEAGRVHADAVIVEGITHTGKPCRIVDNTASIDRAALHDVLDALIRERRFGISGLSAAGGAVIPLDRPRATHIQFGDTLYRILLFPYEARIEPF